MPVEFQKFGPKLRRNITKVLLRERVQQLGVRLIVKPVFSRTRCFTGVKIVVRQVQLSGVRLLPAASGSDPEMR